MFAFIRSLLFILPPEKAHYFTMDMLKMALSIGIIRKRFASRLQQLPYYQPVEVAGIRFPNPLGMAAGFDKNARYFNELRLLGFGFVEIGTVTPLPQDGNPKPRLFRLKKDQALINRMGFNNEGVDAVVERLQNRDKSIVIGGNIGKNKLTPNDKAVEDYLICFRKLFDHVDYFVVNVSSPNTPGLRELQEKDALTGLLQSLHNENELHAKPKPIFLKIAPDLTTTQVDEIIEIIDTLIIAGIVTNNTTLSRENLLTAEQEIATIGAGGLSGKPLEKMSESLLDYILTNKKTNFTVIASGGIHKAETAAKRLKMGAPLVQLWTGFIYQGPSLIRRTLEKLSR